MKHWKSANWMNMLTPLRIKVAAVRMARAAMEEGSPERELGEGLDCQRSVE